MTRRTTSLHKIGLAVLLLSIIAFWLYVNFGDPITFNMNYDPEYPYFLNSLLPFKRQPYRYIDHPGTPVELLGTGFLTLTYPIPELNNETFVSYHLAHPGIFLRIMRAFLLLASVVGVYLFASRIFEIKDWKDVSFSLVVAISFYVFPGTNGFMTLINWSHNSFAFPFGTTLLLLLLVRMREKGRLPAGELIAFGMAAGWLTSIQLWFAAWVLGISATIFFSSILRDRRYFQALLATLTVGISSVFGFILGTLPVLHEYLNIRDWIVRLMTHQGQYGLGEPGFTSFERLAENLKMIALDSPGILLAIAVTLFIIILAFAANRHHLKRHASLFGIAIGLSFQTIFALFMILKHLGHIYLLAISATLPLLLGVGYSMMREVYPKAKDVFVGLSAVILLGFIFNLSQSFSGQRTSIANIHNIENEVKRFKTQYAAEMGKDPEALMTFTGYGIPSSCLSLRFGNIYTGGIFTEEIDEICYYEGIYDIFYGSPEIVNSDSWDLLIIPENKLPASIEEVGSISISNLLSFGFGRVVFVTPLP